MTVNVCDLKASIKIVEGPELYASLIALNELTKQHVEIGQQIVELSAFIRSQVDVQMAKDGEIQRSAAQWRGCEIYYKDADGNYQPFQNDGR
jgi:hypothetical protein